MQEFAIQRCTRKCAKLERTLEAGESYYSVILPAGSDLIRKDIAAQAWEGPPEGAIGWWKSTMPKNDTRKLQPAPPQVLVQTLQTLCDGEGQASLAYLLAVHLLRKRILVSTDEPFLDGSEVLHVTYPVDGSRFQVPIGAPTPQEASDLQKQLVELLFYEA